MFLGLYLFIGIIFAAFVVRGYIDTDYEVTKRQLILGAILDVITWPIVIVVNVIDWNRKR